MKILHSISFINSSIGSRTKYLVCDNIYWTALEPHNSQENSLTKLFIREKQMIYEKQNILTHNAKKKHVNVFN